MKRIYWRPRTVSRGVLALVATMSLVGLVAVERFQIHTKQPYYDAKLEAARLARDAMAVVRDAHRIRGLTIDRSLDPTESGLIGQAMTPVTSDPGVLPAKQASINPNFAAAVVQMLRQAGLNEGDAVAVGCSGSFPALNICVYAAIETLKLRPVVISSAAASQWGANEPTFLWIDMEQALYESHKFGFRSVAASFGGVEDRGLGMTDEGRKMLAEAVTRNRLPLIDAKSFTESINKRMALFRDKAGSEIKAYINIGGGTTSVGTSLGKRMFQPGLNMRAPARASTVDSVMTRFITSVPVIHLTQIEKLASDFGLPTRFTTLPEPGQGKMFYRNEYNRGLVLGVLCGVLAAMYVLVRTELGTRLFQPPPLKTDSPQNEPMI